MRRAYHERGPRAIVYAAGAWIALGAQVAVAQGARTTDSLATLVTIVRARESGQPLAYGVVTLQPPTREQFTNDRGIATFAGVPSGRVSLRVRHLGYSPAERSVVLRPGAVDTIRVELTRVAVSLGPVHVRALAECKSPGPPRAASDPSFAAVFEQLEENADQYRVLATQYPFSSSVERMSSVHYVGGDSIIDRIDTLVLGTGVRWHYAPGGLIEETDDPRNRHVVFNIPALIHFAERSFLDNHCFANGGVDSIGGRP